MGRKLNDEWIGMIVQVYDMKYGNSTVLICVIQRVELSYGS